MLRKFRSIVLAIGSITIYLLVLIGCGAIKPPSPSVEWYIGVDITSTVHPQQFAIYRQIILETVLSRIKNRDRVHVLKIDTEPQDDVKVFTINGGKTGSNEAAARIYQYIQAIEQPKNYRGSTNIGGVISYVKRVISYQQQGPSAYHVVVLLTDGKPEGNQTIKDGDWNQTVPIWVLGVDPRYETTLKNLCTKQLNISEDMLHLLSFATWETGVRSFGSELQRPKNPSIIQALTTGNDVPVPSL